MHERASGILRCYVPHLPISTSPMNITGRSIVD